MSSLYLDIKDWVYVISLCAFLFVEKECVAKGFVQSEGYKDDAFSYTHTRTHIHIETNILESTHTETI